MEIGTITRRMDAVLDGLDSQFKALYSREDFNQKLNALKRAGTKSNRPSILAGLFAMFDACGIKYETGRENAYYEELTGRLDIPDDKGIEDKMLYALYEKYQEYPSPEEYMYRIVERLSSGEDDWKEDSLRVRILKQFIKYGNYLEDAVDSRGKKMVGGKTVVRNYVKGKLGKTPNEDQVPALVDDGVFAGFEEELAKARSRASQMAVSDAEKKKAKEQVKSLGRLSGKFGLLKLADDLAAGKFRTEGATKRYLYWFAMVYGMTYYSGASDEILDYRTDIEKNLFRDYYANNLMRFLSDVYRGRLSEYEMDPSGQGINYKNFAEMIYVYYIANNYSPQEKIRRSAEMINRVQEQGSSGRSREGKTTEKGTAFYRGAFRREGRWTDLFSEDLLALSEEEFERFIRENYDCNTIIKDSAAAAERKVSDLQIGTEQRTAFENYQKILMNLKDLDVPIEECNYGLWFTDVAAFSKEGYKSLCDRSPHVDRKKFEEFMGLLLAVNSFLGYTVKETASVQNERQEWKETSKIKTKALFVQKPEAITRTSLIVVYYYYYNALHEDDGNDRWKNFEELFSSFKRGIDEILEQSYYQPLSGKNIFDVLVVFSSYARLNL